MQSLYLIFFTSINIYEQLTVKKKKYIKFELLLNLQGVKPGIFRLKNIGENSLFKLIILIHFLHLIYIYFECPLTISKIIVI